MLNNPVCMGEFKMSHKKKSHMKKAASGHHDPLSGHVKHGKIEPMAHEKGSKGTLKPMKHSGRGK